MSSQLHVKVFSFSKKKSRICELFESWNRENVAMNLQIVPKARTIHPKFQALQQLFKTSNLRRSCDQIPIQIPLKISTKHRGKSQALQPIKPPESTFRGENIFSLRFMIAARSFAATSRWKLWRIMQIIHIEGAFRCGRAWETCENVHGWKWKLLSKDIFRFSAKCDQIWENCFMQSYGLRDEAKVNFTSI